MKTGEIIIQYFKIAFFRGMYSIPIQGTVEQLSSFFRSRNAMSVLTENLVFYSDHVVTWSLAQVCVSCGFYFRCLVRIEQKLNTFLPVITKKIL